MPLYLCAAKKKGQSKRSGSGNWQISSRDHQQQLLLPHPLPHPLQLRLQQLPNVGHVPEDYSDVVDTYGIKPEVYQAMERHLPLALLAAPRGVKLVYMRGILERYLPSPEERITAQIHQEYRQRILSSYKPLHGELYTMNPCAFFLPTFLQAIRGNTEQSLLTVITEPTPGVCAFAMIQPVFCEMLMAEVENFLKWAHTENLRLNMPNNLDKPGRGAALSDFGLDEMLSDLMKQFISPISTVLYPEVGGQSLDSHHSFVVEYGEDDAGHGLHVDECEVTLNVCLGKQFTGGDMYFHGIRCVNHVDSEIPDEGYCQCPQVPGQALLYYGRHRHGVLPTSSGRRVNFTMWCKSSTYREMLKYRRDFSQWCSKCLEEKRARQAQYIQATRQARISIQPPAAA